MPDIYISQDGDTDSEAKTFKSGIKTEKPVKKETSVKKNSRKLFKHIKSVRRNPLSSYLYVPENVEFVTRDPGEKVVLLLRRHWVTNISWMVITLGMIFAPVVLGVFPILEFLPDQFQFVSVLGWYLITTAYFLENFLSWFFNVNIITDERVMDIDFHNLIYREISEANIDNIQNVTTKLGSVIRTFFNYGDVLVQTASEIPDIEFLAVPKPDKVAEVLRQLRVEEEVEKIEGRVS